MARRPLEKPKLNIVSVPQAEYGPDWHTHLLEQYKLYVESAEKTSDRRHSMNNFFLTINTGALALIGYVYTQSVPAPGLATIVTLVVLAGVLSCLVWFILLQSYKGLNSGKFDVIHELEKHLPARIYAEEWVALGEGRDRKKYWPFSHVEKQIPIALAWFYALVWVVTIASSGPPPGSPP